MGSPERGFIQVSKFNTRPSSTEDPEAWPLAVLRRTTWRPQARETDSKVFRRSLQNPPTSAIHSVPNFSAVFQRNLRWLFSLSRKYIDWEDFIHFDLFFGVESLESDWHFSKCILTNTELSELNFYDNNTLMYMLTQREDLKDC